MQVKYAFFADAARVNMQGTCDMIGAGVDAVRHNDLPVKVPVLAIVAHVEFEPADIGQTFEVNIDCVLPDGSKSLIPVDTVKFRVEPHPWNPNQARYISHVTEIRVPEFTVFGTHIFRLLSADRVLYELPFDVEMEPQS